MLSARTRSVDFCILGPLEARANGDRLPLGGPKQRAVLALLLLHANEVVSRDRLIDGLWGESPPPTASHSLDAYVSRLRKLLGDAARIVTRPPGYVLRAAPQELDLARFENLARAGGRALDAGDARRAAAQLREAESLWRGRPLADLEYEPFAQPHVERLEELRLGAVEQRVDAELALGSTNGLIAELDALVGQHPLRERLRGQLMLALYRAGRQADALSVYRGGRVLLREELGLDPSPHLQELEQAILRQDAALGAPARAGGAGTPSTRRRILAVGLAGAVVVAAGVGVLLDGPSEPSVRIEGNALALVDTESGRAAASTELGARPATAAYGAGSV
jgi:DNA-binding SARP family transcriptional activator